MNKVSLLVNKIKKFEQFATKRYLLNKIAQNMSLDDLTDNSVVYNTNGDDDQINEIKKSINTLIESITENAQVIEDVINGKSEDKVELLDAVQGFISNHDRLVAKLDELNNINNSFERFMVDEGGNENALNPVKLIDFVESAYNAVNAAIGNFAGVSLEDMGQAIGDAEQQALEVIDPGTGGMQWSSDDKSKQMQYEYVKKRLQDARKAEKEIEGYKSPLLEKMRIAQKKYFTDLKNDPERWAAFKEKIRASYEKRRGETRAKFDIVLRKLGYMLLKYNLLPTESVDKLAVIDIHNSIPKLLEATDSEEEFNKVKLLVNEFNELAKALQFNLPFLQQREQYRQKLTEHKKNPESTLGAVRKLNLQLDQYKSFLKSDIKESMQEELNKISEELKLAQQHEDIQGIKNIKKKINDAITSNPKMQEVVNELKDIKSTIKKATNLFPRGSMQSGIIDVEANRLHEIPQIISEISQLKDSFGEKYRASKQFNILLSALQNQYDRLTDDERAPETIKENTMEGFNNE